MVRSSLDCGLFWRPFKNTGPDCSVRSFYHLKIVKTATKVEVRAIQDHKVIEWNTCWKCRLLEGTRLATVRSSPDCGLICRPLK